MVGPLLVLFGALPTFMLPTAEPLPQWVQDPDWSLLNGLALIMTILTPLALASLYSPKVEQSGILGFIGFVMAFVGSVLFSSVQFDEALLWPIYANEVPRLLDRAGPMIRPCSSKAPAWISIGERNFHEQDAGISALHPHARPCWPDLSCCDIQ